MPILPPEMVPELLMPALAELNCPTLPTPRPMFPPEIVPELVMLPKNVETPVTSMPSSMLARMAPELLMPPAVLAEPNWVTLLILMPLPWPEIVPELPMPPAKAETWPTIIPLPKPPLPKEIVPLLRSEEHTSELQSRPHLV